MHRKHTTAEDGMQSARSVSHSGKTLRWYLSIRPVAVLAAAAAALLTTGLVAGPLASISGAAATSNTTSHALATTGLGYTPLTSPVRIADTRTVAGGGTASPYNGKTLAEGTSLTVDVPSAVVPATASAVVVNITAVNPSNGGFLSVYPGGGTNPGTSNDNFAAGQNVGDEVTVGLGTDSVTASTQSFTVYDGPATGGATVDFTADVMGYYAPQTTTSGDAYVGLTPARIYDTRTGSGAPGAGSTLTNGGSINVPVVGVGGVPASATAVALNVAVTNTTAPSFITAFPTGVAPPHTANQNFVAGETLSSQVVAGVGTGGDVTIANHAGNADIVVDVDGYYTAAGGTGSLLTVLAAPVRLTDTRSSGNVLTGSGGIAGGASTTAVVQGAGATAGVLSVADVATPGNGNFLTAYPTGVTAPLAATVNYVPGDPYNIVENAAYATTGTGGSVSVLNGPSNASPANIVVDENGYFTTSTSPTATGAVTISPSTGAQGSSVIGTVVNPTGVTSVTISGCGVTETVPASSINQTTGDFSFIVPLSQATGNCTLTFTSVNNNGAPPATSTAVFNVTAVTPATGTAVAISATPSSILDNGTSTSALVATVTNSNGPVSGDAVTFTTSGTCGTVSPASGTTNASGVVDATYTSSTSAGFCNVTATESAHGTSNSTVITQTAPVASTTFHTSVTATPATVTTTGTGNTSTITATVLGASNAPVANDEVMFTVAPSTGSTATCGTFTGGTSVAYGITPVAPTSGQATTTYTSGPTTGACTITATEADQGTSGNATVTQSLQGYTVSASASPPTIVANGLTHSNIVATVLHNGTAVAGQSVTFTVDPAGGNPAGSCGTIPATPVTTNIAGQAADTYTSYDSNAALAPSSGFCTITASVTNAGITSTGNTSVDQTATTSTATAIVVGANPDTVTTGGTSLVTATVTGAGNTAISGDEVQFSLSGIGCTGSTIINAITTTQYAATDALGNATATFTAGPVPGPCTVTAVESNAGQTGSTTIAVTPTTNSVAVVANPAQITGNGTTTSQVMATVTSPAGVAVPGDAVTFTVTPAYAGGTCGTVPGTVPFTNSFGQAIVTYTSSANAGFCIVTATESLTPGSIPGFTQIDQTSI